MLEFRAQKDLLIAELDEEKIDLRRGPAARRGRKQGQVALPRDHEPRAENAAERHHGFFGGDEGRDPRHPQQSDLSRIRERHLRERPALCCISSTRSSICRASRLAATSCTRSARTSATSSQECHRLLKLRAQSKGLEIVEDIAPDLPQMWVDPRAHPPDLSQSDVERLEVHAQGRPHHAHRRAGARRRAAPLRPRHGARNSQGRNPEGHAGVRPGLAGTRDGRRRHRARTCRSSRTSSSCTAARSSSFPSCAKAPKRSSSCRSSACSRAVSPLQPLGEERHRQPTAPSLASPRQPRLRSPKRPAAGRRGAAYADCGPSLGGGFCLLRPSARQSSQPHCVSRHPA